MAEAVAGEPLLVGRDVAGMEADNAQVMEILIKSVSNVVSCAWLLILIQ